MKRLPLIATFLLFLLLCASLAWWGLQLFKPAPRQVAAPPLTLTSQVSPEAGAALFGGAGQRAAVAANYQLQGVILSGTPSESVAIISAGGNPPKAFLVDKEIEPGISLQEVHRGYVLLSDGGVSRRLELPAREVGQLGSAQSAPVGNSAGAAAPALPNRPAAPASGRTPGASGPVISPRANAAMPPSTSVSPSQSQGRQGNQGSATGAALPQPQQASQSQQIPQTPQTSMPPQQTQPVTQPYQALPLQQGQQGQQPYQVAPSAQTQPSTPLPPPASPANGSGTSGLPAQSVSGAGATPSGWSGGSYALPALPPTPGVPGQPGLSADSTSGTTSSASSEPGPLISR